jgi:hypothetical protein
MSGIPEDFVASLSVGAAPGEQLLSDLDALNDVGTLADGSIPLEAWLTNAVVLSRPRRESAVFESALKVVRRQPLGAAGGGITEPEPPARAPAYITVIMTTLASTLIFLGVQAMETHSDLYATGDPFPQGTVAIASFILWIVLTSSALLLRFYRSSRPRRRPK